MDEVPRGQAPTETAWSFCLGAVEDNQGQIHLMLPATSGSMSDMMKIGSWLLGATKVTAYQRSGSDGAVCWTFEGRSDEKGADTV